MAIDVGKSDVERREHKSIKDAHFDIVVCKFGLVRNIFVSDKT